MKLIETTLPEAPPMPLLGIDARDVIILVCLAQGLTDVHIGRILNPSNPLQGRCVGERVQKLCHRSQARNRIQLVVWAVQWGVITV